MMPTYAYLKARIDAKYHLQVEIEPITNLTLVTPNPLRLTAYVRRIFRGDSTLKLNDKIYFEIYVCRENDLLPCGGIIWKNLENIVEAKYLEVFLNTENLEYSIAASQCEIINELSDLPSMKVPSKSELEIESNIRSRPNLVAKLNALVSKLILWFQVMFKRMTK